MITYCHQYFFLNLLEDCWNIELLASKVDALNYNDDDNGVDDDDDDDDDGDYDDYDFDDNGMMMIMTTMGKDHLLSRSLSLLSLSST